MSAKKKSNPALPPPRRGCLASFFITSAIILLILYIVLLVASRTEGFRYAVSDKVNEAQQTELAIERIWLSPSLTLVLEQVTAGEEWTMDGPALQIDEAQLRWNWLGWILPGRQRIRELRLQGARWRFVRDEQGEWQLAEFVGDALYWAGKAGMQWSESAPDAPTVLNPNIRLTVTNGSLFWWDGAGGVEMALQGIEMQSDEAFLNGRLFEYRELSASSRFWDGRDHGAIEQRFLWIDGDKVDL